MDDAGRRRFREMSVDELRRQVDMATAHIRSLRQGMMAANGMVLEGVDAALPRVPQGQAHRALEQIMDMLPLIQLTDEERARCKPVNPRQREENDAKLEELLEMDPDEFNAAMQENGLEYTYDDLLDLQEQGEKTRLLGIVQAEMEQLVEAMNVYRATLEERMQGLLAKAGVPATEGDPN